jgi:glyoxylase-like metal-dependent hydrolase (beta-lactamase superfamily II)
VGSDDRLYFRQLLSGRDFAVGDTLATQMVNFSYLVGDRDTGEALLVDPAYGVDELVETAGADGMRVSGVLATHHHPDHVGGSMMGHTIEGVARLMEICPVPVHAHRHEVDLIARVTGLGAGDLRAHDGGDQVAVGAITVQLLHTPGHTPGSQCFLIGRLLVSGDTLFLEGCGRTDLPGGDPAAMYRSLRRLAELPGDVAVYPGHRYSVPSAASIDAVKEINVVYKPATEEQWLAMFAR